jgi:signal transduction histidine kinase
MSAQANGNGNPAWPAQPAVLIVTAIEEIETTAAALAGQLKLTVEIAASRAAAVRLLARRGYSVVVVDQNLAETDAEGADLIWKNAGVAIPLQLNFALAGSARLEREIRAALARREREQVLAVAAARSAVDAELKNAITGILLESQLALAEENLPPRVENRLKTLALMADRLRERLVLPVAHDTTSGSLLAAPK